MALETPSWLNLDFMQQILRRYEADNSIDVIDIFTKPATDKGDNYASDMFRVSIEFCRTLGDSKVTEKRSLIIKVAPTDEGARKDMIEKCNVFGTEMSMMTNTLRKMNDLLGPRYKLHGQVLHVQREYPNLLVIEDLATLGFRMGDRQCGLDLAHCVLAIRGLARFHASSVALCEKEPQHKELYRVGIFSNEHPSDVKNFIYKGVETLAEEVETWPELDKRYAEKLRKLAGHSYDVGITAAESKEDEFNVINHGDFWVNNMLFKYNDDKKPIDHIFVDFQMPIHTSPAVDLQYFLNTSPSCEVYENKMQLLIEEYHSTLSNTMKQIGCKTEAPSLEEIQRQMKERAAYGMLAAFAVYPLVLIDKDEVTDLNEMMGKDGTYNNPAYKGKIFRRIMIKRIPMYEEMGLLDL